MIRIKRLNESSVAELTQEDFDKWLDGESNTLIVDKFFQIAKTFNVESNVDAEYSFIAVLRNVVFYQILNGIRSTDKVEQKEIHNKEERLVVELKKMPDCDGLLLKQEFDFYNSIVENYENISDYLIEIEDNGFQFNFDCYQEEFSLYDSILLKKGNILTDDLDKLADTIKIVNSLIKRLKTIPGISNPRINTINNWNIVITLRG